ncbi:hypothetical protein PG997_005320 [Apiospora hydei]|uniref:Uncharacterized protein n=1 Tax=Apiospora hydei TaxID=1337664 RepID=A0ABR1X4S2_9PEZI
MATSYIKTYRLKMEKLKEYLDKQFPAGPVTVKEGEDDRYIAEIPKDLTNDQLNDIEDLRESHQQDF